MKDRVALAEDLIGGFFLFALALIPVVEILLRLVSGSGLVWSTGFLRHAVVWLAWLGSIAASREGVHLAFGAGPAASEDAESRSSLSASARFFNGLRNFFAGAVNTAFAVSSLSFILFGFSAGDMVGIFPIRLVLIILPIGYFSMALRALWRPGKKPSPWLIPGFLAGLVLSWPPLVNLLGSLWLDMPFGFFDSVDRWYGIFSYLRLPLIVLLIFLGLKGLPIYLMLGGTALFLFSGSFGALETLPNEAYNLLTGNMIPAIPLFTAAGYLLSESSSGRRLVRFFQAALGRLPGGLAIVAVLVCAYFTTFTGASGVTILALGGLLVSVMIKSGDYGEEFSRGLITSSGSVGLLFPPALPIIMYGVISQISVKEMFLGGLVPGILLVTALSVMGVLRARKSSRKSEPFDGKELARAGKAALGDLLMPVVLLAAYFGGVANVVETASLAVVYVLILLLVTGELNRGLILRMLRKGVPVIGGVLIILAMAKGLSYYIVDAQVPTMLTAFFRDHVSSRFVFLILLNLALLITGTLMDIYSAILVVAPLIVPLGALYGVHPVQLGIIFLANLQLGYLTPPVGMNLFLASYTFGEPVGRIYRQVWPTYVPWFSLVLLG